MHPDLEAITRAVHDARAATQRLHELVANAVATANPSTDHRPPYTISDVAAAAEATRQTVYRWAGEHGAANSAGRVDVRGALAPALSVLAAVIGPVNSGSVAKRAASDDIAVIVRGLDMGLKSLDPATMNDLTDEDRSLLAHAQRVRAAAERVHDQSGRWPETVSATL